MSYYGISMIKLDVPKREVIEAKIHKYSRNDDGSTGLDVGKVMAHHDIASLIARGDTVYVIVPDAPGSYGHTDKVRVKPGQHEYLESFGDNGETTDTLMALPIYQ